MLQFYYVSFVMDLFLRYAWVLSLTPFQPFIHPDMWLLTVGMIELFRYADTDVRLLTQTACV
jgi:hypothetical protein